MAYIHSRNELQICAITAASTQVDWVPHLVLLNHTAAVAHVSADNTQCHCGCLCMIVTYRNMQQVSKAESFIERRFVSKMEASSIPYQVEITHFNTDKDSIGEIICKRAEDLHTPAVVMAKHNQASIKEFFLGSVSKYCTHHCKQPVIVLH